MNGGTSAAILPHTPNVAAEQIFRPNQFDGSQVWILIQLCSHRFESRNVAAGKRVSATAVEFLEVQLVLNADGVKSNTMSILETAQVSRGAAGELGQCAGRAVAAKGGIVEVCQCESRGVEFASGEIIEPDEWPSRAHDRHGCAAPIRGRISRSDFEP